MNVILENTPLERLCILDIETVRGKRIITSSDPEFIMWREKYKNKETLEYQPDEVVIENYLKNAPLKSIYGKIVCISLAVYDFGNDMIVTTSFYKGTEEEIIQQAVEMISTNKLILAGHNIVAFDLPYLRQRFHILGRHYQQRYLTSANDSGAKPWDLEKNVIDTMVVWKGTTYENVSLAELCYVFGLTDPKNAFSGSGVSEAYYNEEYDKIAEYCEGDVAAVANLILIFLGKTPMNILSRTFDTLKSPYQGGEELDAPEDTTGVGLKELSVIDKLRVASEIDQALEDELVEYLGEVDPEDIDSLRMILSSIYFRPKSRKAEKETFEAEIEEVIENLKIKK